MGLRVQWLRMLNHKMPEATADQMNVDGGFFNGDRRDCSMRSWRFAKTKSNVSITNDRSRIIRVEQSTSPPTLP